MGKVLKSLAIAAVIIGIGFATGGIGFLPAMTLPATGATIGGSLVISSTIGAALVAMAATTVLSGISQQIFGPKITKAQASRLNPSLDPSASRKIVFGETAMNTDVRYFEPSGTDQEYMDYIIATSAHAAESIDEIWFEDRIAWSSSTGIDAFYTGYLTVATVLEGTSSNYISINGGTKWGSTRRLTGCSYVHLRIKRTGTTSKVDSPLVNGLPSRVTIRGKGAKIYDPRLDSTVTGGSGSQRANDQTTWGASQSGYRDNPALQLLWFLLGWKIGGKLSVGCGVPPSRIDLASFITAANICDEAITLAAGGTQPRYRTAGVASDSDARMEIIQIFLSAMNGTMRDSGGKLAVVCMKNDLASPVLEFYDDDIIGDFTWNQTRGLDESFNAIHGKYTDPSNNSLYQAVEYPVQSLTSVDGIERMQTFDVPFVQEGRRAQRIAKQVLQRAQYKGVFSATFNMKALGCQVGNCVWIDFEPLGWANKPFRVLSQGISNSGLVPMTMIEENAAIYSWDASELPLVTPVAPTVYNPLNSPFILGTIEASTTADWSGIIDDNGDKPEDNATRNVSRGAWATSTAYIIGDIVSYSGSSYTCILGHTSSGSNTPPNTTYWALLAQVGSDGPSGLNNAVISLYQRSSTTPPAPSGTFTYTFSTGVLSGGTPGAWTQAIPAANGNPLWVIAATASSSALTDTIAAAEFSSPVITTGAGNNVASVFIFQRAASAPAVPSTSLTYTFLTGLLSGTLGSWTQSIPAGTDPVYVSTATASSTGTTDTIATGEWAIPTILAQDGSDGATGATGVSTRTVFQRSATAPATPAASSTTPSGWYDTTTAVPAGSNPMWSTTGERASGGTTYAWGAPIQVQAIVSVSTGQFVNLSFTVSSTMSFSLAAGESRLVEGSMDLRTPTGPGTAYVQIEYRTSGGTWTASNGTVGNYDSGEPLYDEHSITVTNSGSTAQAYEVRGTIIRSNTNSGTQNASTSVLRI